jgi:hypothetical protein
MQEGGSNGPPDRDNTLCKLSRQMSFESHIKIKIDTYRSCTRRSYPIVLQCGNCKRDSAINWTAIILLSSLYCIAVVTIYIILLSSLYYTVQVQASSLFSATKVRFQHSLLSSLLCYLYTTRKVLLQQ